MKPKVKNVEALNRPWSILHSGAILKKAETDLRISRRIRQSRFLYPVYIAVESEIAGFGIRNTAQGIRNLSSSDNESAIHGVESRIQDCLGFPYIG